MNDAAMWAERDAITALVDESPTNAIIYRDKLVPNGFGGMTTDPYGTPQEYRVRFRIAHDRKQPPEIGSQNGEFFTSDYNRIATWEWDTEIKEGDVYTDPDIQRQFSFGRVDILRKFGGIVGYQASVQESEYSDSPEDAIVPEPDMIPDPPDPDPVAPEVIPDLPGDII